MQNDISPEMNFKRLAAVLSGLRFTTELTPDELAKCRRLNCGAEQGHNSYFVFSQLRVQLCLGGKQRTFAVFKPGEFATAYRLADLLVARFWTFRQRIPLSEAGSSAPPSSRLNLSLERLLADLKSEVTIVQHIDEMRGALIEAGVLSQREGILATRGSSPRNAKLLLRLEALEQRVQALERTTA